MFSLWHGVLALFVSILALFVTIFTVSFSSLPTSQPFKKVIPVHGSPSWLPTPSYTTTMGSSSKEINKETVWRFAELPSALFASSSSAMYFAEDVATKFVHHQVTIVMVLTTPFRLSLTTAALQSLHLLPDLRTCQKALVYLEITPMKVLRDLTCGNFACCSTACREAEQLISNQEWNIFYRNTMFYPVVSSTYLSLLHTLQPHLKPTEFLLFTRTEYLFTSFVNVVSCLRHMLQYELPLLRFPGEDGLEEHPGPFLLHTSGSNSSVYLPKKNSADTNFPFYESSVYVISYTGEDMEYLQEKNVSRYKYPKKPFHTRTSYDVMVTPHVDPQQNMFWHSAHVNPVYFTNRNAFYENDPVSKYVAARLTIVITAAPMPSAPSMILLKWLLQSLLLLPELRNVQRLLCLDYPKPTSSDELRERYEQFQNKIVRRTSQNHPLFHNTKVLRMKTHGHLTGVITVAMEYVQTPYVMLLQQDLPFIRPVNVFLSLRSVELNSNIKHIRFNTHPNSPSAFDIRMDTNLVGTALVPVLRTEGWSDQNHIARKSYYTEFVLPYGKTVTNEFKKRVCKAGFYMECYMNKWWNAEYARLEQNWSAVHLLFGTYLYGSIGEKGFTLHVDASEKHGHLSSRFLNSDD